MNPRLVRALAWGAFALSVAFGIAATMLTARNDPSIPVPLSAGFSASLGTTALISVGILSFSGVGALIAIRRPGNAIGWLFCVDGVLLALTNLSSVYETHGLLTNPGSLPGAAWFGLVNDASWLPFIATSTAFLFLLFPEGRAVGRARRTALWVGLIAVVLGIAGGLMEASLYSYPAVPNPIGLRVPTAIVVAVNVPAFLATVGVLLFSVGNLLARLRRASGEERLQLRLFTYSVALVLVFFVPSITVNVAPTWLQVVGALALVSIPIAVAVATLRYRLYDLDIVIKKTAVVLALTLLIAVPCVLVLAAASVPWLIWAVPNPAFTLVGGVVLGVIAIPLFRSARRVANRVVYGTRATSYEVLADFSGRLADTYATDDVLPRMAQVLASGTGAETAVVWLKVGEELQLAAVWPTEGPKPLAVPLGATEVRHQGEVLGALSVDMPANDPMDPSKEALVRDLASQAGLVLRNVRLIEDLRGSRRRIVAAQDERARKLERNIHDGAQQQLVALQIKLRLADTTLDRDPAKTHVLLQDLQREANEALENLRDLARGIYPPLLADKGLPTALEAQARKSPMPVEIDSNGTGRYTPAIESAVYFSCLEALQNVTKYADASRVTVQLAHTNGTLAFEVRDDGSGFDPTLTGYGTGLQGIADRLAALGGELVVTSAPGDGTAVAGRLPVEEP